jgi:phage-related protein
MPVGDPSLRSLTWLQPALETVSSFPSVVRIRLVTELIHARRFGHGSQWKSVKGVTAAVSYSTTGPSTGGRVPCTFSIVCGALRAMAVVLHAFDRRERQSSNDMPEKHEAFVRARMTAVRLDRSDARSNGPSRAPLVEGIENPFLQVGFSPDHAADLLQRAALYGDLRNAVKRSGSGRVHPTVGLVLGRHIESVTVVDLETCLAIVGAEVTSSVA